MLRGEASHQGPQDGAAHCCYTPNTDGVGSFVGPEHVADAGASCSEYRTTDETGKESKAEQHGEVDG